MGIYFRKLLAALVVGAGLCLVSYPWISDWAYSRSVDSEVKVYQREMADTDSGLLDRMLEEAKQYNSQLTVSGTTLTDPFFRSEEKDTDLEYEAVLSVDEEGLMCFVEIPKIYVYLPVFHGTSQEVLEKGAGHLEGSSVPVGGEGTHAVLSAHTGIDSAKMFSDLTEMEEGDLFFIHVLGETLAYRVCGIQVILPEDTSSLVVDEDKDLVTLLTCTPYGINSHRLIVTGERTEYSDEVKVEAKSEAETGTGSEWMKAYKKALFIGLAVAVGLAAAIKMFRHVAGKIRYRREESG